MNLLQKLLGIGQANPNQVTQGGYNPQTSANAGLRTQPAGVGAEDDYTAGMAAQPVNPNYQQVPQYGGFLQGMAAMPQQRITSVGTSQNQQALYDPRLSLALPPNFGQYGLPGMDVVRGDNTKPQMRSNYDYMQPL